MKSKEKEYTAEYWITWRDKNRPLKTEKKCVVCGKLFSYKYTDGKKTRCNKCKILKCQYCGKPFTPENGQYKRKLCSKKCHNDSMMGRIPKGFKKKNGVKPRTYHITNNNKYGSAFDRDWRSAVLLRDNYTCQICGQQGGKIQAHHIKPWKEFQEIRHDINNGMTLCLKCHSKTDTYGWAKYWKNKKECVKR